MNSANSAPSAGMRRSDGVGSVPLCGRYQGAYRQPAAGRDEQREGEPASDQRRRGQ